MGHDGLPVIEIGTCMRWPVGSRWVDAQLRTAAVWNRFLGAVVLAAMLGLAGGSRLSAQQASQPAPAMTGRYHFLGSQDQLAILQEETMLKGFIDVYQGENESDAILSYPIASGSRHGNRVEFNTRAIHEKYYRFSGMVEPGKGKRSTDSDYLQLVGTLETCTANSVTGATKVVRQNVVFKSMGKGEGEP